MTMCLIWSTLVFNKSAGFVDDTAVVLVFLFILSTVVFLAAAVATFLVQFQ